jgi:hypothetical protein
MKRSVHMRKNIIGLQSACAKVKACAGFVKYISRETAAVLDFVGAFESEFRVR